MTKITKSIYQLDEQQIKQAMKSVDEATFPEMDEALKYIGKEVIASYALWYITKEQREKLSEYKEYRKPKNTENLERHLFDKLTILENFDESPMLYQMGVIEWRMVVASCHTVMENKEEKNKANWWKDMIIEIYKSETPKVYEYAKNKYTVYQKSQF